MFLIAKLPSTKVSDEYEQRVHGHLVTMAPLHLHQI